MVNVSNTKDLANLRQVFLLLKQVIEEPDKYDVVSFDAELGTSRAQVPSMDDEVIESAAQRLSISLVFAERQSNG